MNKFLEKIASKLPDSLKAKMRKEIDMSGMLKITDADRAKFKSQEMGSRAVAYGHTKIPGKHMSGQGVQDRLQDRRALKSSVTNTTLNGPRYKAIMSRILRRK